MVIYTESSAILAWLFDEPRSVDVIRIIDSAERIVISDLTAVECARAVHRALKNDRVDKAQARKLRTAFTAAAAQWDRLELGEQVLALASGPFPAEPVRALDAIHLASSLVSREVWPELGVLSLDDRVRTNARALGFLVLPENV